MAKLLILRGLPASGKSTYAEKLVKNGNWVRLNKDTLRLMFHYGKYSHKNESAVFNSELLLGEYLLLKGWNVVVDDTNLNPKIFNLWKALGEGMDVKVEVKTFKTDLYECIRRDADRKDSVGRDVIVSMALQYDLYPKQDKGIIICDIDGTLADISHRLHYVRNFDNKPDFKKDWKSFFEGIKYDTFRYDVEEYLIDYHNRGHKIFLVSARPDTYKKETEYWLRSHMSVPYEALFMRRSGDHRDDTEVKREMYDRYFKNLEIETVIDDRPKVIRMWRDLGLNVIDVGKGVEF